MYLKLPILSAPLLLLCIFSKLIFWLFRMSRSGEKLKIDVGKIHDVNLRVLVVMIKFSHH